MNRAEALRIGTVIANRWWRHNKPNILSQQHIEKQKAWQQIKALYFLMLVDDTSIFFIFQNI
ncbi:TPA: hypothetical protein ACXXY0_001326 [Enterococcus faecium]|nr:hypothetical protein [Enterococcus faecium]HCD2202633.1 hypothetical protein [Enterococcus faecium]HCD2762441.1 hypothetical protein [Enterococcus faecium]HCD3032901.1 hypothetical protein [Enterococcus faecium]HCR3288337.1 hypothetical protein [Enterococcus faecium]